MCQNGDILREWFQNWWSFTTATPYLSECIIPFSAATALWYCSNTTNTQRHWVVTETWNNRQNKILANIRTLNLNRKYLLKKKIKSTLHYQKQVFFRTIICIKNSTLSMSFANCVADNGRHHFKALVSKALKKFRVRNIFLIPLHLTLEKQHYNTSYEKLLYCNLNSY